MTPEKWFVGAIALIRRPNSAGDDQWLSLWNSGRNCYHFVEAHKLPDESFRDSLQREVAWTTGLKGGRDYLISSAPRAHLQLTGGRGDSDAETAFVIEFFLVELMGKHHRPILESDSRACWIDTENLRNGEARDGRPICPQLLGLLKEGDVVSPWRDE